jgi:Domain of unknown function (DUF4062)
VANRATRDISSIKIWEVAMKCVYISSTIQDLTQHRAAVSEALRNIGYGVDAMEKYPARDDRPKAASEADVAKADYYVGIFAWRYGYVPLQDNPEGKSITELEYIAASKKPRFIFLLDDHAAWPSQQRDAEQEPDEGKRIREFRNSLKRDTWAAFFSTPDELAKKTVISLLQYEATKKSEQLAALSELQTPYDFGASFLPNLRNQFETLGSTEFVSLQLGANPWWDTRLHLAAALASDFTEIRQFLLLNEQGHYLLISSPGEIRRALTKSQPKLELAYLRSLEKALAPGLNIDAILLAYTPAIRDVFGQSEQEAKRVVTPTLLRELGIKPEGEIVEQGRVGDRAGLVAEIIRKRCSFVVLTNESGVEGIVDRVQLLSRLASLV